jgi:transposase
MSELETIRAKFESLRVVMNERMCRLWAGCEARSLGRGGMVLVAEATGLSLATIRGGIGELGRLDSAEAIATALGLRPEVIDLIRRTARTIPRGPLRRRYQAETVTTLGLEPRQAEGLFGWGREAIRKALHERRTGITCVTATGWRGGTPIEVKDPAILTTLERLIENDVAGDPMGETKWVRASLSWLSQQLKERGHGACPNTVRRLLKKMGYSMKSNKRRQIHSQNVERDQQFRYIASQRERFKAAGLPVISVDTKKKELIGNFRNAGKAWCKQAEEVDEHDFPGGAECKAVPFGIYDVARNAGHVVVGVSNNTPEFAVNAIAGWWAEEGVLAYPGAEELLVLADGGGGNGSRAKLWRLRIQEELCDRFGLEVTVCHYPPGCSKWNPVEHRLFSQISINWAGKPLRSLGVMLAYIRGTTTATGLRVTARLDEGTYRKGLKVSRQDMDSLNLRKHDTCPAWNYTISPRQTGAAGGSTRGG